MLLAPGEEVAAFVAGTYRFDEVCRIPVTTTARDDRWEVHAGPLDLAVRRRTPPCARPPAAGGAPTARHRPRWISAVDVVARRVLPVRTQGSAGQGRREYYAALRTCAGSAPPPSCGTARTRAISRRWTRRCGSGSARRRGSSLVQVVTLVAEDEGASARERGPDAAREPVTCTFYGPLSSPIPTRSGAVHQVEDPARRDVGHARRSPRRDRAPRPSHSTPAR